MGNKGLPGDSESRVVVLCFIVLFIALCAVAIPCIALALGFCEQSEPDLYEIKSITPTIKTAYKRSCLNLMVMER